MTLHHHRHQKFFQNIFSTNAREQVCSTDSIPVCGGTFVQIDCSRAPIYILARLVMNMQLMAMPRQEIYILVSDEVNGNLTKLIDRNATSAKP
jgi:hypothetical protein